MSMGTSEGSVFRKRGVRRVVAPMAALVLSGGLLWASPTGMGQAAGVNQGGPAYVHGPAGMDPIPGHGTSGAEAKMDQMREAERHRRLLADAAKLAELSSQLKAEVDQSPENQLPVDVLRKAGEIEKTAHDLKGWVKY